MEEIGNTVRFWEAGSAKSSITSDILDRLEIPCTALSRCSPYHAIQDLSRLYSSRLQKLPTTCNAQNQT